MPRWPLSLRDRFMAKIEPEPNSAGCRLWIGHTNNKGYGMFFLPAIGSQAKRMALAHRVAWEFANGAIPPGMCCLHRCDTPTCCNIEHLFLGTQAENVADMARKRRGSKSKKGMPYGVSFNMGTYCVQVWVNGKRIYLGRFRTESEASEAAASFNKSHYSAAEDAK